MVTCGTYQKAHFLNTPGKLDMLRNIFFECINETEWTLHAWAFLSNHYHFIASSPGDPSILRRVISKLHTLSARELNAQEGQPGRKIWFQYFDTHITYTNSYLPRLKYVHQNPAHHGVVENAENYRWCSASWFGETATAGFRRTVEGFKINSISVKDDFTSLVPAPFESESGVKPPHSKLGDS